MQSHRTGVTPIAIGFHAHLHRVEGDLSNAAYWYARAGRSVGSGDLEVEWESIVRTLLKRKL
jgi:hypothetical protein